jgi:hypothetical protein
MLTEIVIRHPQRIVCLEMRGVALQRLLQLIDSELVAILLLKMQRQPVVGLSFAVDLADRTGKLAKLFIRQWVGLDILAVKIFLFRHGLPGIAAID